jgi:hypothetical protein
MVAPKFAKQLNGAMSTHVRRYVMRKIIEKTIPLKFEDMGAQKVQLSSHLF